MVYEQYGHAINRINLKLNLYHQFGKSEKKGENTGSKRRILSLSILQKM